MTFHGAEIIGSAYLFRASQVGSRFVRGVQGSVGTIVENDLSWLVRSKDRIIIWDVILQSVILKRNEMRVRIIAAQCWYRIESRVFPTDYGAPIGCWIECSRTARDIKVSIRHTQGEWTYVRSTPVVNMTLALV
jgi:hypothetical protein